MKQLLFLLFFPAFTMAQYPGNGNQKLTLGEQTTADGLVYRGLAADTTRKPSVDTMAYILLDTNTNIIWQYKKAVNNAWTRVGGSISSGVTGVLPIANGGTGQTTLAAAGIVTGTGTTNYLPKFTSASAIGNSNLFNDANGNVGLGVSPSAWGSGYKAIQNNSTSWFSTTSRDANFGTNVFVNSGGNYAYIETAVASLYTQYNGVHSWNNAPSGTAGNAISFTQAMTLDASGNLLVGTITNPYSKGRLVVSHTSNYDRSIFLRGVDFIEISPSGLYGSVNFITSNYTSGGSVFSPLALSARQNTADLYLSTSGNVGIGTASPGYTLQIKNSDASATVSSADGTAEMRINAQSGLAILETITNTDLRIRTNSTERMRITSGGNVGIGTASPAVQFHTTGDVRFAGLASITDLRTDADGDLFNGSDFNLKNSIDTINFGLSDVLKLKPVSFNWNNEGRNISEYKSMGFIAQDVMDVIPNAASTMGDGDMQVDYNAIVATLTKAIQEQNALIKALEQRILTLENK